MNSQPGTSSVSPVFSVPSLRAVRLVIRTRWQRPTVIPGPVVANVLRGALGITLRKLVCPEGWFDHHCPDCPLYRDCAYGQVFMPSPPEDATQLRLQQDLPRPFVIEPPGLHPDDAATSEGLTFRLMLFGTAISRLPYLISTLDRLGYDGLGRDRVPFTIEQINTSHPAGDETLFTGGGTAVSLPKRMITTADLLEIPWSVESATVGENDVRRRILARMGQVGGRVADQADPSKPRLKLNFLTPLLLKSGSGIDEHGKRIAAREIRESPPFGVLLKRLRDRLSALVTFFCEGWDGVDFKELGQQADRVRLIEPESRTVWLTRNRRSTRTGQSHEISGLVGHAVYEFPDEQTWQTFAPLLRIGELIHVGKNAPWGNGAIRAVRL